MLARSICALIVVAALAVFAARPSLTAESPCPRCCRSVGHRGYQRFAVGMVASPQLQAGEFRSTVCLRFAIKFSLPELHKYLAAIGEGDIIAIIRFHWEASMANLIVRNVTEDIIKALKRRAGRHGTSAEAEHRKILAQALLRPPKRSFAEAIAAMPNVGRDSDFERVQDQNSLDVLD